MYWVSEEWPQDSTKRSRPTHWGSAGSKRRWRWNNRYAAGARDIAVPGWPLPTFWTASMAKARTVSTARLSKSVHSNGVAVLAVLTESAPSQFTRQGPTHGVSRWDLRAP